MLPRLGRQRGGPLSHPDVVSGWATQDDVAAGPRRVNPQNRIQGGASRQEGMWLPGHGGHHAPGRRGVRQERRRPALAVFGGQERRATVLRDGAPAVE